MKNYLMKKFEIWKQQKKILNLKKILAGNSKEQKIPDTAQKTITFERMYNDGICLVNKGYYTKMIEFSDINYNLLAEETQMNIQELYGLFLNFFEPGIRFQILLFNRRVNAENLVEKFNIRKQDDDFNELRNEFTDVLKNVALSSNNGVIKSKYLIYGLEAKNIKEARIKFDNIEPDIIKNLSDLGSRVNTFNGKERLRVLHEYFNQDTMEPFKFSHKEQSDAGKTQKDYVAPSGFDFRYPSRFRCGNIYGISNYVGLIAPTFNDELLRKIVEIDDSISVTLHMQTIRPEKATKMVKTALSNVQKMKIEEQKKAVRSGYDMDILPTDIVTYEHDMLELMKNLTTSNQKLLYVSFLVTCFGKTKREAENLNQRVSGLIQQAGCNLRRLQYLQEQGLMATSPIGINETGIERVLTTECTAILIPFNTQELFMDAPALFYGQNTLSGNMIMADRKRLRTPNGIILGTPGSGKSFYAKKEMLGCYLMTNDDIIVCDPEGEYYPVIQALGGQVVKLATDSKDFVNPMDIQLNSINDAEALKIKSDFIITLCDVIAGGRSGLENDEKGIIDECIRKIYAKYFENPVPENMPILGDLYDALMAHENKKAERIANSLVLYVHGSQNYFNHRSNVDINNRVLCFDIRDLSNQLKQIGMLIVQDMDLCQYIGHKKLNFFSMHDWMQGEMSLSC